MKRPCLPGTRLRHSAWSALGTVAVAASPLLPPVSSAQSAPAVPPAAVPAPAGTAQAPSAAPTVTATAQGGTVQGKVVAGQAGKGGVPLPGVAVTATNTLTGRRYTAATDVDGAYMLKIPRNGRYVIRAELAGFAPVTAEVVLSGDATASVADLGMQLASRVEAAAAATEASAAGNGARSGSTASLLRNLQGLSLNASGNGAEDASGGSGNTGAALPSLGSVADAGGSNAAADTVAVSGAGGRTNGLANFSEDELRERIQQGIEQARASGQLPAGVDPNAIAAGVVGALMGGPGGPGGPGGGGRGGGRGAGGFGRGSGAFRNINPTQLHGGFNYQGEYAALDSAPWSPTLTPQTKPSYAKDTFGGTLAGSPYIPGLIKPSTKQFGFLNFNVSRNTTPEVLTGIVPTDAQRTGNFSSLVQTVNGTTTGTPIYDPTTGTPFAFGGQANVIDPARLTPQALYVLNNFYPHANVNAGTTQTYNYQTVTTVGQNSANLSTRFIRNLGANSSNGPFGGGRFGGGGGGGNRNAPATIHQSLNFNFSYSHSASDIRNIILPLSGASQSDGYNLGAGYIIGKGRFNTNSTVTWNRSHSLTRNYFTDTADDPAGAAGITLPDSGAIGYRPNFYNGLPTFSISNFLSVNNTDPQDNIAQTISFSEQVSYRHSKHNYRLGLDVRRVHQDYLGGGNPLGAFTFTGLNTESPQDRCNFGGVCADGLQQQAAVTGQAASGAAFADFLLGLPQQSQIQAGLSKIYLRENVVDWYANDDYRLGNGVTLNGGVRYEFFGPYSEINNRLVNLTGVAPGTTGVGCVTPSGISVQTPQGTLTCAPGPTNSLIHPDRTMFSPRFGVAWRPHWVKDTVLRAGYGINYNTTQFSSFAHSLSFQAPFATTQNNVLSSTANSTGCNALTPTQGTNFTVANAFGCSGKLFQNTYAVDPNYRLGLVQVFNVDLQRTMPLGIVLNLGYNGSHGGNLNVVNAPNHTSSTVTTPDAVAFVYQQSIAQSDFNALTVSAQKRLQRGVALGARYQYAHSIDDASSINGAAETSSIQDPANLLAERSNSSFDVRHSLSGTWLYELPVGPNRAFLHGGGIASKLLDGLNLSGSFNITSGHYFTPSYQATAAQIAAGGTYTLRPDRDFAQPISGAGSLRSYFNSAAFAFPVSTTGYGTASRYSIEGPGTLSVNASLSRTIPLTETRSFEARITANNVFNTVQYSGISTTLDAANFGQVTGAAAMRQINFVGRFRF